MRIKTENMPKGLPPGEYEVEMVKVEYTKGQSEPTMHLRFLPPVGRPPAKILTVEVEGFAEGHIRHWLEGQRGVRAVYDHPHGCCCQHCPHGGNCRD